MKKIISALLCVTIIAACSVAGIPSASAAQTYDGTIDDFTAPSPSASATVSEKQTYAATQTVTGNVALNKTVTVSGVESGAEQCTGDLTVDGTVVTSASTDTSSRWSAPQMKSGTSSTQTQTPQWLVIDLGASVYDITSIKVYFFKLVWSSDYVIKTSSSFDGTLTDDSTWTTVKEVDNSSRATTTQYPTDEFTDITDLERYVLFYFNKVNYAAGGSSVSVSEIEIYGSQDIDPSAPANAAAAMNQVNLALNDDESAIVFPEMNENYEFSIKGSEFDNIISTDGTVTPYLIGDREVTVLAQVVNKSDSSDVAEKNFTFTVHDKSGNFPELFPEVDPQAQNAEPQVIPSVQEWYGFEGDFALNAQSKIVYNDAAGVGLQTVAESMSEDLCTMLGLSLTVTSGASAGENDIYLESLSEDTYNLGSEGSLIIVNDNGAKIYAPTRTGVLYGTYTVMQGMLSGGGSFPYGVVRDYPEFEVRGIMIDVARAPFRLETLQQYQKILSWFKINEMHMHINDDRHQTNSDRPDYDDWEDVESMFRLESELFPSLTTTAKDSEYFNSEDGYGGTPTYTKDEWREFQTSGADLGINVITEIDLPAHALALTSYVHNYPNEAAAAGITGPVQSSRHWELMALSGENYENSNKMMTALYSEYINGVNGGEATFISDTVHIGADEYWNITSDEKTGFANYVQEISEMAEDAGKKVRMWAGVSYFLDNSAEYSNIELDVWDTSYENVSQRISEGYSLVNVCNNYLYNNALRDRRDIVNVEHLYENWNPYVFTNYTANVGEPSIIGAKTAVWQDVTDMGVTEADNTERIVRAGAVLAEKTWGGTSESQTYSDWSFIFSMLKNGVEGADNAYNADTAYAAADFDFANVTADADILNAADGTYADINGSITLETDENGVVWGVFDGNDYISTGLSSLNYPYTVSFDIKSGTNGTDALLFSGSDGWLYAAGIDGEMSIARAFFNQSLCYTLPAGAETNITIVGTQEAVKLYVNGSLVKFLGRQSASESDYDNLSSTFVFPLEYIGKGFNGKLANIRAYNKALSPETVQALYTGADASYVNVAQNKGVAGDAQNIGLSSWDVDWKKLNVGWKAIDGDSNSIDGQYSTSYTEKNSFFEGAHADSSLALDLWQEYEISRIVLQWDRTPTSFKLQTSDDGVNWTDLQTFTASTSAASVTTVDFDEPITTRYLKMQGVSIYNNSASYTFKLREFMAFEKVDKESLTMYASSYSRYLEQLGYSADSSAYLVGAQALSVADNPVAEQRNVDAALADVKSAAQEIFPEGTVVFGDANFDGAMNVKDATVIQKYAAKIITAERINAFAADLDSDGAITGMDTTLLQKYLVNLLEMPK